MLVIVMKRKLVFFSIIILLIGFVIFWYPELFYRYKPQKKWILVNRTKIYMLQYPQKMVKNEKAQHHKPLNLSSSKSHDVKKLFNKLNNKTHTQLIYRFRGRDNSSIKSKFDIDNNLSFFSAPSFKQNLTFNFSHFSKITVAKSMFQSVTRHHSFVSEESRLSLTEMTKGVHETFVSKTPRLSLSHQNIISSLFTNESLVIRKSLYSNTVQSPYHIPGSLSFKELNSVGTSKSLASSLTMVLPSSIKNAPPSISSSLKDSHQSSRTKPNLNSIKNNSNPESMKILPSSIENDQAFSQSKNIPSSIKAQSSLAHIKRIPSSLEIRLPISLSRYISFNDFSSSKIVTTKSMIDNHMNTSVITESEIHNALMINSSVPRYATPLATRISAYQSVTNGLTTRQTPKFSNSTHISDERANVAGEERRNITDAKISSTVTILPREKKNMTISKQMMSQIKELFKNRNATGLNETMVMESLSHRSNTTLESPTKMENITISRSMLNHTKGVAKHRNTTGLNKTDHSSNETIKGKVVNMTNSKHLQEVIKPRNSTADKNAIPHGSFHHSSNEISKEMVEERKSKQKLIDEMSAMKIRLDKLRRKEKSMSDSENQEIENLM